MLGRFIGNDREVDRVGFWINSRSTPPAWVCLSVVGFIDGKYATGVLGVIDWHWPRFSAAILLPLGRVDSLVSMWSANRGYSPTLSWTTTAKFSRAHRPHPSNWMCSKQVDGWSIERCRAPHFVFWSSLPMERDKVSDEWFDKNYIVFICCTNRWVIGEIYYSFNSVSGEGADDHPLIVNTKELWKRTTCINSPFVLSELPNLRSCKS